MQFKVPQFLDIEDKLFGPFTFSEFVYLAGGGGLVYVIFKALGFLYGFIPMALVGGFAVALVFYKPNGKPFLDMIQSSIKYFFQDKLYIWKIRKKNKEGVENKDKGTDRMTGAKIEAIHQDRGRLSQSKLRDLAWSLDVLDIKKEEN